MRARIGWTSTFLIIGTVILLVSSPAGAAPAASAWSIVPSGNEDGSNWLRAVAASAADDAWAVGWYIPSEGGPDETLAVHWDGTTWSVEDTPNAGANGDQLFGVAAVSSSEAWAVGSAAGPPTTYTSSTVIEHWTGSAWTVVPSPNPSRDPLYGTNQLYDVKAFAPNDVWAAGWQQGDVGYAPLVERWDGRSWKVSKTPSAGSIQTVALDGTSSSDIWAVGYRFTFGRGDQSVVLHYDGSHWSAVPTPVLGIDNYLNDVAVVSPTDAWAVGYSRSNTLDIQPYFLHWDGSAWRTVPSPHLSSTYNFLQSIVAESSGDVWAGGYRTVDREEVSLVEHWDGTAWRLDPTANKPDGGNFLYGLASDPGGGLWSAGYFYPEDFSPFTTLMMHRSSS
jgi:hypothetical protein